MNCFIMQYQSKHIASELKGLEAKCCPKSDQNTWVRWQQMCLSTLKSYVKCRKGYKVISSRPPTCPAMGLEQAPGFPT